MLLEGKTMVVTGGNSGIGEAIVLAAAREGANVVIDYVVHPEETSEVIARIEAAGGHAVGVQADVSKVSDLHRMVQTAADTYGQLDVLVNNAGVETRTSILETTEQDYDKVLDINLKSAFFGTQFAAKQFIAQGHGGLVINISSVHEEWPMPGNVAYCVSKGGTRMLTRTAGVELGPHGVRVVNVGPGGRHPDQRLDDERPAEDEGSGRGDPAGADGTTGGDRRRRRVPGVRKVGLPDGNDGVHRRRHHAGQRRPLSSQPAAGAQVRRSGWGHSRRQRRSWRPLR